MGVFGFSGYGVEGLADRDVGLQQGLEGLGFEGLRST